jgi:MerR family copper efflux transcriptional regulator
VNIGEAAKLTGVPAKTIRFYEAEGLLQPARTGANYRAYGERDLAMLRFIQRARALGFSVREVGCLVALWQDRRRASAEVRRLAAEHIAEIDAKLAELQRIRSTLQDLVHRCHGDQRPDCPIIDELAQEDSA